MISLTPAQQRAFDFIKVFHSEHGFSPSYDEIKDGLGLASKGQIFTTVGRLEERGVIRRLPGRARAIEIVDGQGAEHHLRSLIEAIKSGDAHGAALAAIEAERFLGRAA